MLKEDASRRGALLLAVFVVAHALVLVAVVALQAANEPAFQVEIFRAYADRIAAGEVPYAGFPYEYPPLSLLLLILPRLLASEPVPYAALFGAEMLLFDVAILAILSRVGARPLVLYGLGVLLFWRIPFIRHDLAPVAAATLGALFLLRGRALLASVLWGVGGALKLYPMAAVPALAFGSGPGAVVGRFAVAGAAFAGGIGVGVLAYGPEALSFLSYHSERPAMIESFPANVLLLFPGSEVTHSFGSFNVVGPFGETLVRFFELFQPGVTLAALLAVWLQGRRSLADPAAVALRGAAVATFAFAVFGKVLSPHFLLWPLPLLAISTSLGGTRLPRPTWGLLFAVILLTTLVNEQYWAISENLPLFTAMLSARNLLLLPLFALLLLPPGQGKEHRDKAAAGDDGV